MELNINNNIKKTISSFLVNTTTLPLHFRKWIKKEKLQWYYICAFPEAVTVIEEELERNPDRIVWNSVCSNPRAIHIVEKHIDNLTFSDWCFLCENPFAIELLQKYDDNIIWGSFLFRNPRAMELIKTKIEKDPSQIHVVYWNILCENKSKEAIDLVEKYLPLIENRDLWANLCKNPYVFSLLEKHKENIDWYYLCFNPSPSAFSLIEQELETNPENDKISWSKLCCEPGAIRIINRELEKNPNSPKIFWNQLCSNPLAMPIIENNLSNLNRNSHWCYLSENPGALPLLLKHKQNIYWNGLCRNPNPDVIPIIEEEWLTHPENINWYILSSNPIMISLIEKYIDVIEREEFDIWDNLSRNSNIFIVRKDTIKNEEARILDILL